MPKYDIAIIGGGILGTCISYWLSSIFDVNLCVIEKESNVAMHASSRNTGVVHSPFYLNPNTKKTMARAALVSRDMWEQLARSRNIPWKQTGVFEIALDEEQHQTLEEYMVWGERNGIPEGSMRLLDAQHVLEIEPNLKCYSAIYCDREASTNFGQFTKTLKDSSTRNGTKFLLNKNVVNIKKNKNGYKILLENGSSISASLLINCAGGNSLDVAHMMGFATEYSDLHFRGEYWIADDIYRDLVRSTVYTVAEFKEYPFLDPHWIRRADGSTEIGPNAVPVPGPEIYSGYLGDPITSVAKLGEVLTGNALKLLSNPDFISLLSREWFSSLSKTAMVGRVQKFIPKVHPRFFSSRGTAGIRSPIITPSGKFLPDVLELEGDSSFHIINYNSPGATGAPAYSAFLVHRLRNTGLLDYPESSQDTVWRFTDVIDQS